MNDTGSDIQTVYQTDFNWMAQAFLQNTNRQYVTYSLNITTAGGSMPSVQTKLQVSVIARTNDPRHPWNVLMDWQTQMCIIQPAGRSCLTGDVMRKHLWFCTPRGNARLFVAENKTTLLRNIPAYVA